MTVPFKTQFISQQSINSANIIDRTITSADIALGTIDISNLSASCIASLGGGGGGGLTANSVDSSHIINRSILGIDISLGQISEAHFDASFTTQLTNFAVALEEAGDAIKELSKLQGVIGIRNATTVAQGFGYMLSYKHPTTGILTTFASYTKLDMTITATHFFKLPSLTHKILIEVDNGGGVSVEGASIIYGGTIEDSEGNNILLSIDDVNVMVEIEVAI